MLTIPGPRAPRGLRRRAGVAVAALATTAVVSGLTASPVASLTPTADCPTPFPVSELTAGQAVKGLTVTKGTTPEGFSGEILGVLHDGIAPGLDMIMARLTSTEIDRVGIWQGMSGSPVYAEDGKLIGAVSYGLAWGSSPVAGITPAEEMYRLLDEAPQTSAPSALRIASGDGTVALPTGLTNRLVSSGVTTRADANAGMSRLPLPLTLSGLKGETRLEQATKSLDMAGVRIHEGGGVNSSDEAIPVVAGGNLAASLSYGDVSAVGVGTATAVCGDEVLAFGHPMTFTGPSQLTMHGADALYIQEDPLGPGFKVANPTAPVGAIKKDGLAGLFGVQQPDAVPATTDITSLVQGPGGFSREGTTRISVPDYVPDISAFHLLADEDRGFDGIGGGSATVGWRVDGRRADGRSFTLQRTDKFADQGDLSFESVFDLYDALAALQFNDAEHISINKISTTSDMSRVYKAYNVSRVRVLVGRKWQDLRTQRPLFLRPGFVKKFLVYLSSDSLPSTRVLVRLPVPENIGTKSGVIRILGGNSSGYSDEEYYYFEDEDFIGTDTSNPPTFDKVLARLRREPRNDQVLAKLILFRRNGSTQKTSSRATATEVVNGGVSAPVQGLGMPSFRR